MTTNKPTEPKEPEVKDTTAKHLSVWLRMNQQKASEFLGAMRQSASGADKDGLPKGFRK